MTTRIHSAVHVLLLTRGSMAMHRPGSDWGTSTDSTLLVLGDSTDFVIASQQCHDGGFRVESCRGLFGHSGAPSRCMRCLGSKSTPMMMMWMIYGVTLGPPYFPAAISTHALSDITPALLARIDVLLNLTAAAIARPRPVGDVAQALPLARLSAVWLSANLWDVARLVYPGNRRYFSREATPFLRKGKRKRSGVASIMKKVAVNSDVQRWIGEWRTNATRLVLHIRARVRHAVGQDVPLVFKSALPPLVDSAFRGWNRAATVLLNRQAALLMPSLDVSFADVEGCCARSGPCEQTAGAGVEPAFIGKSLDGLHPGAHASAVIYRCVAAAVENVSTAGFIYHA
ncbi:hypothetical protein T492DRAFT_926443 [Pavlovales sp. CCMP2436]|nr:hypothetical protein T492DRAFT_926443 [Pavlovales sp. CCMP2436]